jgi:hypothetical protein
LRNKIFNNVGILTNEVLAFLFIYTYNPGNKESNWKNIQNNHWPKSSISNIENDFIVITFTMLTSDFYSQGSKSKICQIFSEQKYPILIQKV